MDERDERPIKSETPEQEQQGGSGEKAVALSSAAPMEGSFFDAVETTAIKEPHKRKNNSKPVECMDLDGNLLHEFKSGAAASTRLNLTQGDISQCCRGLKDSAGGYKFRFKDIDYFQAKPMNPKRLAQLLDSMDVENSIHGGVDTHNFGMGMRSKRRDSGRHSLPTSSSGTGFPHDSFDGHGGESYGDLQGLAYTVSDFRRRIMESAKRPCVKWTRTAVEFGANQIVLHKWVSENTAAESKDGILADQLLPKLSQERKKYARR